MYGDGLPGRPVCPLGSSAGNVQLHFKSGCICFSAADVPATVSPGFMDTLSELTKPRRNDARHIVMGCHRWFRMAQQILCVHSIPYTSCWWDEADDA